MSMLYVKATVKATTFFLFYPYLFPPELHAVGIFLQISVHGQQDYVILCESVLNIFDL